MSVYTPVAQDTSSSGAGIADCVVEEDYVDIGFKSTSSSSLSQQLPRVHTGIPSSGAIQFVRYSRRAPMLCAEFLYVCVAESPR